MFTTRVVLGFNGQGVNHSMIDSNASPASRDWGG